MANQMLLLLSILTITLSVSIISTQDPTPPSWGGNPQYKVNVSLLNNNPKLTWNFTYYYDWTLKAERYEHSSPQADEQCLWADPPTAFKNDQCTVVFAKDGWSYVSYPKHNWCCKCGNAFGAIRYDWLQNGSHYIGQETVNGYVCQHWTKQGLYLNHYYNTVGEVPVLFHEIKEGNPKNWTFNVKSYVKGPVDPTLFDPQCSNLCLGQCRNFRSIQTDKKQSMAA